MPDRLDGGVQQSANVTKHVLTVTNHWPAVDDNSSHIGGSSSHDHLIHKASCSSDRIQANLDQIGTCTGLDSTSVWPAQAALAGRRQRLQQFAGPEVSASTGGEPLIDLKCPGLLERIDDSMLIRAHSDRRAGVG